MREHGWLCSLALALLMGTPVLPAQAQAPKEYVAVLSEMNGSSVSGVAQLTLVGDQLTVRMLVSGLQPGTRYGQYIRGFTFGPYSPNAICPPASADTDGDGIISFWEGFPYFGPIVKSLFESGGTFPTTTASGTLDYEFTYDLVDPRTVSPLQACTVVLQAPADPFAEGLPLSCGEIVVASPGREKR